MPTHSFKSMYCELGEKCKKCGNILHKTNMTGRLFCRTCWEYQDNKLYNKEDGIDDGVKRKNKRRKLRIVAMPGESRLLR